MKKLILPILLLVLLITPILILAQDSTEVPTAEATVSPTASPQPPVDNTPGVVGGVDRDTVFTLFAVFFVLLQGVLFAITQRNQLKFFEGYKAALERRDVQDAAEREYLRTSAPIKDIIALFKYGVKVADNANIPGLDPYIHEGDEFLDNITDGQPNTQ